MKLSPKQTKIMEALKAGPITLAQAVGLVGGDIYTNENFHVGNIMSRLIKRGAVERVKPGVYRLAPQKIETSPGQKREGDFFLF